MINTTDDEKGKNEVTQAECEFRDFIGKRIGRHSDARLNDAQREFYELKEKILDYLLDGENLTELFCKFADLAEEINYDIYKLGFKDAKEIFSDVLIF